MAGYTGTTMNKAYTIAEIVLCVQILASLATIDLSAAPAAGSTSVSVVTGSFFWLDYPETAASAYAVPVTATAGFPVSSTTLHPTPFSTTCTYNSSEKCHSRISVVPEAPLPAAPAVIQVSAVSL
ncbi:hypothetical protein INT08_10710 [Prosthecochloris sp. N3]|uniref:Uncharacterized protein n=1 Tax=Prosthecochloris ethylica TaxID=2743976 RepID=A0ABR9XUK9_9CHLB|nr:MULTISPECIES: hypothetical protein [Prosthecochloris]MBF0587132.1 hypothetical protein [Prosthecochloris ethylica]MBF0637640.1 hypothetical protein [Prosthecochloris ethylica]NUK48074.1 hypothetical protein [Prosthecochloris ethylica]RNA64860.1 hypothetical protein CR163_006215 [Prosthecochloris sp. ZM_2]